MSKSEFRKAWLDIEEAYQLGAIEGRERQARQFALEFFHGDI